MNPSYKPEQKTHLDHSVEYVIVVVAVPAVDTEVLHSFGASEDDREENWLYVVQCE